jgi:hypothetical protein
LQLAGEAEPCFAASFLVETILVSDGLGEDHAALSAILALSRT